jgi:hypothetical protein
LVVVPAKPWRAKQRLAALKINCRRKSLVMRRVLMLVSKHSPYQMSRILLQCTRLNPTQNQLVPAPRLFHDRARKPREPITFALSAPLVLIPKPFDPMTRSVRMVLEGAFRLGAACLRSDLPARPQVRWSTLGGWRPHCRRRRQLTPGPVREYRRSLPDLIDGEQIGLHQRTRHQCTPTPDPAAFRAMNLTPRL